MQPSQSCDDINGIWTGTAKITQDELCLWDVYVHATNNKKIVRLRLEGNDPHPNKGCDNHFVIFLKGSCHEGNIVVATTTGQMRHEGRVTTHEMNLFSSWSEIRLIR